MTAVITGGSRGIGLGIAKELLKEDFTVILTARNESEEVKELKEKYGGKVHFISCDNSKNEDIENLATIVERDFGKIDLYCEGDPWERYEMS